MSHADPVFGELKFTNNAWETSLFVAVFDKALPLSINNSESHPPAKEEQAIWQRFIANQEGLKLILERIISDYYARHLAAFRMPYSVEEEEEYIPTLKHSSDIWKLIEPISLWIEMGHENTTCCLSINFKVHWDEEHGMDVSFYGDEIGVAESGAHWLDHDRYDLQGQLLQSDG